MHKMSSILNPFGIERVSESEKLLKSAEKNFYFTFSSFWAIVCKKNLVLVRSKILGLLVRRLTANYQSSGSNREN